MHIIVTGYQAERNEVAVNTNILEILQGKYR